ncbi:hypothetical protein FSY75_31025 [Streptomyces sp. TR1341]|uniref:Secreted protein n=2 Tax=Streptomyces TaxID=1883 RepID=A0A7W3NRL3_STRMR|nr:MULTISPECIES: hypothetical protein [Streptomyces]MBA9055101.1 hypothetical protein [Streptomyces murinus]NDK28805.1 hypothetical protein [Streptomyces sp. TR1341]UWW89721.1 hypothetical protein GO605_01805 [Streptomyces murinus]
MHGHLTDREDTMRVKRFTRAIAATVALAAFGLVAPAAASADDGDTAEVGSHCTPWEGVYGHGGTTYTDLRTCVDVLDHQGDYHFTIETNRTTYRYGGIWYSASDVYPAGATATVRIEPTPGQEGPSEGRFKAWTLVSRSYHTSLGAMNEAITCGTYHLDVNYEQTGPYYGHDRVLIAERSFDNFVIPCS